MTSTAGNIATAELDAIQDRCRPVCNPADESRLETVKTWERLSDLGFAVGAVGLGTAAIFLWVVPRTSSTISKARRPELLLRARMSF